MTAKRQSAQDTAILPADGCKSCRQYVRLVNDQAKQLEALSALAVAQRDQLAKLPGPLAAARALVKRFSADELDTLTAELIRLQGG